MLRVAHREYCTTSRIFACRWELLPHSKKLVGLATPYPGISGHLFRVHDDRHLELPCVPELFIVDKLSHEMSHVRPGGRAAGKDSGYGGPNNIV